MISFYEIISHVANQIKASTFFATYILRNSFPTLDDNRAAVLTATNSGSTKRAKHMHIKCHFVFKDIIEQGDIQHYPMTVDIFTKPLDKHKFTKCSLRSHKMLEDSPHGWD